MTNRTPLGELYETATRVNGWVMREVAERARERGGDISKSRIGQLVNENPLSSISAGMIDALALGLNLSRDRVALAAVQSMGFRVGDTNTISPAEAIARDADLSADTKVALMAILSTARPSKSRKDVG